MVNAPAAFFPSLVASGASCLSSAHNPPRFRTPSASSSGFDPGICKVSTCTAEVVLVAHSTPPTSSPAPPMQRIPGSSPRMTRGSVETRVTKLIPASITSSILAPTNPLIWTQAQRTFGGRLAGKVETGFPVRRPTCQLVSVRVPCGSLQGRPKADRWPDEEPGVPRRTGETRRGTADVTGNGVIPTNPSPRRRHKPKIPDAWGDDRFI